MLSFERLNNLKLQQYNMMAYSQVRNDFVKLIDAEIARQSATSEEVAEAIEELMSGIWQSSKDGYPITLGGKTLDLAITALQTYQPWVSVSERLPDADVASVLIHTNKGGVSEGQYYPCIKSWKQFRWSVENADVTHWMPLPKPPKEVKI